MTTIHSPYGGFSEGDHVTRDGTDVQLVKDMTNDGFSATFVCVQAPASGWCSIGEEEHNLCRRYERVTWSADAGAWQLNPGERRWEYSDQLSMEKIKAAIRQLSEDMAAAIWEKTWRILIRRWGLNRRAHQKRYYRNPKRRALRK
jgi:hypothetical protein